MAHFQLSLLSLTCVMQISRIDICYSLKHIKPICVYVCARACVHVEGGRYLRPKNFCLLIPTYYLYINEIPFFFNDVMNDIQVIYFTYSIVSITAVILIFHLQNISQISFKFVAGGEIFTRSIRQIWYLSILVQYNFCFTLSLNWTLLSLTENLNGMNLLYRSPRFWPNNLTLVLSCILSPQIWHLQCVIWQHLDTWWGY